MTLFSETPELARRMRAALLKHGLCPARDAEPVLEPVERDAARRDRASRRLYRVRVGEKTVCLATVGAGLRALHERTQAFARACPSIACRVLFYESGEPVEILAQEFFDGVDLEEGHARNLLTPGQITAAIDAAAGALDSIRRPSTREDLLREVEQFRDDVLSSPHWGRLYPAFSRDAAFRVLVSEMTAMPPERRWTNGDFIPCNILVNREGQVRVVDCEFAGDTHFFAEDWLRLISHTRLPASILAMCRNVPRVENIGIRLYFLARQIILSDQTFATADDSACVAIMIRDLQRLIAHVEARSSAPPATTRRSGFRQLSPWRLLGLCRVMTAGLFDAIHYSRQYPDVRESRLPAWLHFVLHGAAEGRDPNPFFDSRYYLRNNPDVVRREMCPVVHYLLHGAREGRDPGSMFSTRGYEAANPDVAAAGMNPLAHYLRQGIREGRPLREPRPGLGSAPESMVPAYVRWLAVNEFNAKQGAHLAECLFEAKGLLPRISVVIPVYNPPLDLLNRALASVEAQTYPNWEICLADDGSSDPAVRDHLASLAGNGTRVRLTLRGQRGHIAQATNSAAELATGEFLLFLDQDDELSPDALAEVALYAAEHPEADLVYSDCDKIAESGQRYDPLFKPDWSPELLLSFMYAGQVLAVRRSLFTRLGGMRDGFAGAQDHDLALRASEVARHVGHIPRVLYHWRAIPGSTAVSGNEKNYSFESARKAVQEALERRGSAGRARQPEWAVAAGCAILDHDFPDQGPAVAIIIPTRDHPEYVSRCLRALAATSYRNYEVVVVDDACANPEALRAAVGGAAKILRVERPDGRFNFSRLMNAAVESVQSEYVLFLNDDTEAIEPRWLSQMVGYAQLPGVGAVGARLEYPDGRIQHAGIVQGMHDGMPGHAFRLLPAGEKGYMSLAAVARNCSGVTAACMLTSRRLFTEAGGFDEQAFAVAYNDPDYCLRLAGKSHRTVYCPSARLIHHEGQSRGYGAAPVETAAWRAAYGQVQDPYVNPNLAPERGFFELAAKHVVLHPRRGPLRILAFTHNLNLEGAPLCLVDLLTAFKKSGRAEVSIVSFRSGLLADACRAEGMPVILQTPVPMDVGTEDYCDWIGGLSRLIEAEKPDVVCANTLATFEGIQAAAAAGVPSVWWIHESEDSAFHWQDLHADVQAAARESFAIPYRCVFVSHATRAVHESMNTRGNFAVIHNGLAREKIRAGQAKWPREAARKKLGLAGSECLFLNVGTLCGRKGQMDIVDAVAALPAADVERMRVCLVGNAGGYGEAVERAVRALGPAVSQRVSILPHTSDPALYYQAADVFVCSSRVEAYPMVTLEAMAHGLPIVTTPVFGIGEQMRENENALFYQPGNSRELARHMSELLASPDRRQKLASQAGPVLRSLASHEEMCRAHLAILEEASLVSAGR